MSTLDHLTDGRVGWNIVTGYLDSASRALGQDGLNDHDDRYDRADDYLEVLYKLWEGSWDDDAVIVDKAARIYSDPARVQKISHDGPYYKSQGYHLAEPSRQRTPVLYQAGSSGRGKKFAARHAECIFINATDPASAARTVKALCDEVVAAGRRPDDVKIFVGITVVTAKTAAQAEETLADYLDHASPEAGLAHFSASTGLDFSRYAPDEEIHYGIGNAIQSVTQLAKQKGWTRRQLLKELEIGRYPLIVGDGAKVAEELIRWVEESGVDGFNLTRTVVPESYEAFIEYVIPELQSRGAYKENYSEGSLRHRLFGRGDRLPESHFANRFRTGRHHQKVNAI
jgi:FMN-dependent oxidoreductase (nitrilotriacetate monooxygenase family)